MRVSKPWPGKFIKTKINLRVFGKKVVELAALNHFFLRRRSDLTNYYSNREIQIPNPEKIRYARLIRNGI